MESTPARAPRRKRCWPWSLGTRHAAGSPATSADVDVARAAAIGPQLASCEDSKASTQPCCATCACKRPDTSASAPSKKIESTARRKRNSWDGLPSVQMVVTMSVCLGNPVIFAAILAPLLEDLGNILQWCVIALFIISYLIMFVAGLWVMIVDPSANASPTKHTEVLYCRHCEDHVRPGCKHCWDCMKCVPGFDHHCPWLNTCIGERNYRQFFVAIWAALACGALQITAAVSVWTAEAAEDFDSNSNAYGFEGQTLSLICGGVLAVNVPLCIADFTLVAFHVYLCVKGITTYEYLKRRTRDKPVKPVAESQVMATYKKVKGIILSQPTTPNGDTSGATV